MATPKKGQLCQFMVPMVNSSNGLSVMSTITESDFNSGATVKFFGVNHGSSAAFTSGTVSKTARLVRSGVFQICLKGTENNYDMMMVRVSKTGAAEQIITWDTVDNDDSDLMSALTVIQSMASDAASAAAQANSRVLLNQSRISDTYSMLSDFLSDFQSRVPKAVATNSQLSDLASDLRSYLVGMSGMLSDTYSQLSDFRSDLDSLVTTTGVQLNASTMSDLRSAIAGVTATLSASDISDIASAVDATLASRLSDILSAAQQTNSRVLLNQSRISDVQSFLSNLESDLLSVLGTTGVQLNASTLSDLRSAISGGPAATVTASDISDIASAVWAFTSRKLTSNISLNASDMSDIRSAIAAGPAATVTASDISDIASAVRAILISDLSDIHSAATAGASRALLNQSRISDVYSMLSDLQSDFQSRVPKAVATNSQLSDLASDLRSYLVGISGTLSDTYSQLSDFRSDLNSFLTTTGVQLNASTLSDLRSAIADAGVSASSISDIASAVKVILASDISDILSAATQVNSRVLLNQSRISDVYSMLSDLQSDLLSLVTTTGVQLNASSLSDLRSAIAGVTTALSASDISDIASAVWATAGADPTAVPAATGTMKAKLDWLAALARNKLTQTATKQSLRNDADAATIASAVVSDDGTTFTRGEFG